MFHVLYMVNTKQKEILKKIRALPLRKYGSAKHKKLIKEYIKHDPYFPPSKILRRVESGEKEAASRKLQASS